jgi:hypothetical protein
MHSKCCQAYVSKHAAIAAPIATVRQQSFRRALGVGRASLELSIRFTV